MLKWSLIHHQFQVIHQSARTDQCGSDLSKRLFPFRELKGPRFCEEKSHGNAKFQYKGTTSSLE